MNRSISSITDRIEALSVEASEAGDSDMIEMCERAADRVLRDDRTGAILTPEDLWGETPVVYYVRAICASLDAASESGTVRGVIQAMGLDVYATAI